MEKIVEVHLRFKVDTYDASQWAMQWLMGEIDGAEARWWMTDPELVSYTVSGKDEDEIQPYLGDSET